MSSARVWIRIIFCVKDIVAMLPRRRFRIKCIQIIETVCMRSTTSEKIKLIADIAKLHAGSGCWTFADYFDLRPSEGWYLKYKQIIQSLRSVPSAKNVKLVLDYTWAMISSWWWSSPFDILYTSPMQTLRIQLMKIIKIIASITASEHINFILITIRCMHIAGPWRNTRKLIVQPFEFLKV